MSLRTKTLLLFLAFVLVPLGAVGIVSSIGTRMAVERVARASLEESSRSVSAEVGSLNSASADEILAPLDRLGLAYIAFVLLVGGAATVGFRLVTTRIFSSLDEFRGAVEQIAKGDFTPWLPPPGKDEVGWLALALGRMAERMGQMMRTVEQGGRLAVVGEMAAHMAHEVRTPLSSIKMNLQLLERSAEAGHVPADDRVSIETSLREIDRLETTVTRILQFGVPERVSRHRCSLHEVITESADLVRGAMEKEGIALRLDLGAESDWIWADGGRVKGVFLNLLVNALHEMPDGGEILVETQLFLGEGGRQMVAAAVSDSGPGVPAALRDEIFHPFFTTKSEGCGMGLPAALRTIREHGGDLYLSRRPDGLPGACFMALLPLAPPNLAGAFAAPYPDPIARAATTGRDWRGLAKGSVRWADVARVSAAHEPTDDARAGPGLSPSRSD